MQKPEWLRVKHRHSPELETVENIISSFGLNTICKEANCPNYLECFSKKTATFMILGAVCTRNCRFCNVRHDIPAHVDKDEPERIAEAVKVLGLQYVVITSVTRDDLPDGGAEQFFRAVGALRKINPYTTVEVLIPDFLGDKSALERVIESKSDVISHNMETVASKYADARPEANYRRSLGVIERIAMEPNIRSKTGIMLGLGETKREVLELFDDLRGVGCEFLTIGQYLAPTRNHYPIHEYISPEKFDEYKHEAYAKGFAFVASAPFVRSSYRAGEAIT